MLLATPKLTAASESALAEIEGLEEQLAGLVPQARLKARLLPTIRGSVASSSVAIEGYDVTPAAATSILAGARKPAGEDDEIVAAYGRAMDHVAVLVDDPLFKWNHRVIADLHFDLALPHGEAARPGRLRTGGVAILGSEGVIYTAPAADAVAPLVAELVTWLRKGDPGAPVHVRAAMAHLHLVSIHPFADGNGRASRVLQSLVLGLGRTLAPELTSIEEYLAAHTGDYYDALNEAHGPIYDPTLNAAGWIEFCLQAHVSTARGRLKLVEAASRRWTRLEGLAADRGWPDRLVIALEQALSGGVDRAGYTAEAGVSDATASADLRRLVDAGLLSAEGAGRTVRYVPMPALRALAD